MNGESSAMKRFWVSIPRYPDIAAIDHFLFSAPADTPEEHLVATAEHLLAEGVDPTMRVMLKTTVSHEPPPGLQRYDNGLSIAKHGWVLTPPVLDPGSGVLDTSKPELYEATRIPSGYNDSIHYFASHCRAAGVEIADSWWEGSEFVMAVDADNLRALNALKRSTPRIFGNPITEPEVAVKPRKDPEEEEEDPDA